MTRPPPPFSTFDPTDDSERPAAIERQPEITVTERAHYSFLHAVGTCAVSGTREAIEIEHLRDICFEMNKKEPGMARKPHYAWCLPLAGNRHRQRHEIGSSAAFRKWGWPIEDVVAGPLPSALVLFGFSCIEDVEGAQRWLSACALRRMAKTIERS